jgi:hypothetical protein
MPVRSRDGHHAISTIDRIAMRPYLRPAIAMASRMGFLIVVPAK